MMLIIAYKVAEKPFFSKVIFGIIPLGKTFKSFLAISFEQSSSLPKKLPFFRIRLRISVYPCQLFFRASQRVSGLMIFSSKTNCTIHRRAIRESPLLSYIDSDIKSALRTVEDGESLQRSVQITAIQIINNYYNILRKSSYPCIFFYFFNVL